MNLLSASEEIHHILWNFQRLIIVFPSPVTISYLEPHYTVFVIHFDVVRPLLHAPPPKKKLYCSGFFD